MSGAPLMDGPLPPNAALLLIDVQQGIDEAGYYGARNNPGAESQIARLLAAWRASGRPIIHVRHHSTLPDSPLRAESPGSAFKPEAQPAPGEPVITKHVNSAFIGTDLEQQLRAQGINTLVIAGLTTQHCVSTSVRMAGNLGFATFLVGDACAASAATAPDGRTFDAETVHSVALAALHGEFALVVDAESVLARVQAG